MKAKFAVFLVFAVLDPAQSTGATNDEIKSVWDVQRTALQSVVIRCKSVRRRVPIATNLGRDEVHKLLGTKDLSVDEGVLKDVVHRLDPSLKEVDRPWTDNETTFDEDSVREDMTFEGITRSHVWHRDLQIVKEPRNQQITIKLRKTSTIRIPRIEDFVWLPPQGIAKRLEVKDNGQLVLSVGNRVLKVDPDTGLVKEYLHGDYNIGSYREVLQFNASKYGDVVVPAWRFEGEYVKKRLHRFTLRILDELDFKEVTDESFAVVAEPGSVIVDRRGERKIRRIKEPSVDVATLELDQAPNED